MMVNSKIFETFITVNDCCESDNRIAIDPNPTITEIACPDDTNGAIDITVTNASNFPTVFAWSKDTSRRAPGGHWKCQKRW